MTNENLPGDQPPPFPSLDQLAPDIPPVSWLWPGWIPRGMITLLCATPGAGKSYVALDLARRLIAGLSWPDGAPSPVPAAPPLMPGPNVVYVDAEAAPQLLNARAVAWGLDRSHLFPMLGSPFPEAPAAPSTGAPEQPGSLDLNAPACRARLAAMVAALHPPLVIVDSLSSAGRGAENQVSAVTELFGFLNSLAAEHQCALLLIHHLRKPTAATRGPRAASALAAGEVRGSSHIVSLARSVLSLTEVSDLAAVQIGLDPQPDAPRRLQLLKSNLGPPPAPLGITFVPTPTGAADLVYGPAPEPYRPRTLVESCAHWLLHYLEEVRGPVDPTFIIMDAWLAGYSRATLYRARELLGPKVLDTRARHAYNNCWVLAPWPRPKPPTSSG